MNGLYAVLAALPLNAGHWEIPIYPPAWGYAPRVCRLQARPDGDSPEAWIADYARAAGLCVEAFGVLIESPSDLERALWDVKLGRRGL